MKANFIENLKINLPCKMNYLKYYKEVNYESRTL